MLQLTTALLGHPWYEVLIAELRRDAPNLTKVHMAVLPIGTPNKAIDAAKG